MKTVTSIFDFPPDTEHHVITLDTEEPVLVNLVRQIDDLLISSPDGDILIKWDDVVEWDDTKCMLLQKHDNLKEFGNIKCTKLIIKPYKFEAGQTLTVFLTIQRN